MSESNGKSLLPYLIAVGSVAAFALFLALVLGDSDQGVVGKKSKTSVGVVEIAGPIMESRPFVRALEKLAENQRVAAVVLRIDSPGGAVGPSQEIYHAVLKLRDRKPVVVSMGSVAASGGFYIASAGTHVMANAGTLTGSIGVIMAFADITELLDWAKIKMEVVKTGQFKDTGSGYRPLTDTERGYLQNLIDEVLEQFVADVMAARAGDIAEEELRLIADGRVFTGATGVKLGVVDSLGGFAAAVSKAAELGEIEGKPDIVEPRLGPPWYERMLQDGLQAPFKEVSNRMIPLWAIWIP